MNTLGYFLGLPIYIFLIKVHLLIFWELIFFTEWIELLIGKMEVVCNLKIV